MHRFHDREVVMGVMVAAVAAVAAMEMVTVMATTVHSIFYCRHEAKEPLFLSESSLHL